MGAEVDHGVLQSVLGLCVEALKADEWEGSGSIEAGFGRSNGLNTLWAATV